MNIPNNYFQLAADLVSGHALVENDFAVFEKNAPSCKTESEFIGLLTILAFSKEVPTNLDVVSDFLGRCLRSEHQSVRSTACIMALPRFLRRFESINVIFLPILEKTAWQGGGLEDRKSALAALYLCGQLGKDIFMAENSKMRISEPPNSEGLTR